MRARAHQKTPAGRRSPERYPWCAAVGRRTSGRFHARTPPQIPATWHQKFPSVRIGTVRG